MKLVPLIILLFLSFSTFAHVDTKITVSESGELEGLPEEYQASSFDRDNLILSVRGVTFTFPPCVAKYFEVPNAKFTIGASWYHNTELLPPYIHLNIESEEQGYKYHLLFNLNNLKPIEFRVDIKHTANSTYLHELVIDERCSKSIGKSYAS